MRLQLRGATFHRHFIDVLRRRCRGASVTVAYTHRCALTLSLSPQNMEQPPSEPVLC